MNSCSFIGRAGKDAETRYTQGGKPVTGWSIAVDCGFGDKKQTVWIDCNAWGERFGKVGEYIKKGNQVGVTGELGTREYNGKTYITLNVQTVTLVGGKPSGRPASRPAAKQGHSEPPAGESFDDDQSEVPF